MSLIGAPRRRLRPIVIAVAVVFAAVAVWRLPVGEGAARLGEWMRGAGAIGAIAYLGLYAIGGAVAAPHWLLSGLAGFAYGALGGLGLAWPGMLLGSSAGFALGRGVARRTGVAGGRLAKDPTATTSVTATPAATAARSMQARGSDRMPRWHRIDRALARRGLLIVLLLRLAPLAPQNFMHHLFGATGVRPRDFLVGTALGMLPATAAHAWAGSLVRSAAELLRRDGASSAGARWPMIAGGLALTALAMWLAGRVVGRAIDRATAEEPGPGPGPGDGAAATVVSDDAAGDDRASER